MSTPPYVGLPPGARRLRLSVRAAELAAIELAPARRAGTVLLVPGFTGSKEDFVAVLAPFAEAGYRAVAIDQRGQYQSPPPADAEGYSLEALGQDVLDVVAALGDGPVHALGHSFGGLVVRAAAVADPASFRSVTLLGSGPAAIPPPRADIVRQLLAVLPQLTLEQIWAIRRELDAEAGLPRLPEALEAFLAERFVSNDPAGLAAMAGVLLAEADRTDALAATGLPLHVAYGEADDAWAPAEQAVMAVRLRAAHTVIPGTGHSPAAQAPEVAAKALLHFWAEVDGLSLR